MLVPPLLMRLAVAPYELEHVASSMVVMHLSISFTLVGRLVLSVMVHAASAGVVIHVVSRLQVVRSHLAARVAGTDPVPPLAEDVHPVVAGVCMQVFRDDTSVVSVVQVVSSHLAASLVGMDVDSL